MRERTNWPPGPHTSRRRADLPRYDDDRLGFLKSCLRQYGDVFSFDRRTVVVNSPDLIHHIFSRTNEDFLAEAPMFSGRVDYERVTDEAEGWMAARRQGWRGLNRSVVAAHSARLVAVLDETLLATGGAVTEVLTVMKRFSGRAVADFCFGEDAEDLAEIIETNVAASLILMDRSVLMPRWLPLPSTRRFTAAREDTTARLRVLIARRRASGAADPPRDLLDVLLAAGALASHQVEEMLRVTLLASYGVPGAALAWAVREMAMCPDLANRLAKEAGEWGDLTAPPDIAKLPFAEAFVKELLRMYTPTWLIGRDVRRPTALGRWHLDRGDQIMFSPLLIHRDARWWPEPDRFNPGRWLAPTASPARHTYLPFGAGPRVCLGTQLGTIQLTLAISRIAQAYDVACENADRAQMWPSALLVPDGLRAGFRHRSQRAEPVSTGQGAR